MAAKEKVEAVQPEMSDQEVLDIFNRFSLSVPIRIPEHMLTKEFSYRWINRKDQRVFTRRKGVGWSVVKIDDLPKLVVPPYKVEDLNIGTHTLQDGSVAIADDLVLAKIPTRFIEAYKAAKRKQDQEKLRGGRRRFHQAGELLGVKTEEDL